MLSDRQFQYPKTPDDPDVDDWTRGQFQRVHEVYGTGDISAIAKGPIAPAPWPRASRRKDVQDYDPQVVQSALRDTSPLSEVDPRFLHSTQPSITRGGVEYYMGDEYKQTGTTYAEQHNPGNRFPVVYEREGVNMLLSGHHRASAALLRGEPLRARKVAGGWGPARG